MSLPGLPALPANVSIFNAGVLLAANAILTSQNLSGPWGVFYGPIPIIYADNVVTVEFSQEYRISRYPVEQGSFASYNKVAMPFETRLRFSKGGNAVERQLFIESIAAVIDSIRLFNVVTPEKIYTNCNFIRQQYDRKADSAGLISVDVWLEEVRETAPAAFTNTKNPTDQSTTQGGLTQAFPRPAALPSMVPPWGR
jgi:hypothetical protein